MNIFTVRQMADGHRRVIGDFNGELFDIMLDQNDRYSIGEPHHTRPNLPDDFGSILLRTLAVRDKYPDTIPMPVKGDTKEDVQADQETEVVTIVTGDQLPMATKLSTGTWTIAGHPGTWYLVKNQGKCSSTRKIIQTSNSITAFYKPGSRYAGLFSTFPNLGRPSLGVRTSPPRVLLESGDKDVLVQDGHILKLGGGEQSGASKINSAAYRRRNRGYAGLRKKEIPFHRTLPSCYDAPEVDSPEVAIVMSDPSSLLARFNF